MAETAGKVGLDVVVNVESAIRDYEKLLDTIRKSSPVAQETAKALTLIEHSMKGMAAAGNRNTPEFKRLLVVSQALTEVLTEQVKVQKEVEQQQKATAKAGAATEVQKAIDAHNDLVEQYRDEYKTLDQVDAQLEKLRSDRGAVLNSEQANTQAGRDAVNNYNQQIGALEQVRHGLVDKRQAEEEAARAQQQHTKAITTWIKQAFQYLTVSASLYYVYRKVVNAARDLAKEMLKNTDEAKALDAASVNLKASLYAAFGPEVLQAARELADIINSIAGFIDAETSVYRMRNILYEAAAQQRAAGTLTSEAARQQLYDEMTKGYGALDFEEEQLHRLAIALGYTEEEYKHLTEGIAAQISTLKADYTARNAETDALEKTASAAKELTDYYLDLADAEREAAQSAATAKAEYESVVGTATTPGTALGTLAAEQMRIQHDLAETISDINADAAAQRADAYANYYSQLRAMQRQAQRQEEDAAKQHQLEMEYMQKRYQLDVLQNERIYQYNRQQLVAEGDVLAIEDLDARYELERQAAEENYELQREQTEAMYRLQAEIQAEAMAEQIAALKDALTEQLTSIEESRQERIADAQAQAAEEQAAAQEAYAQALIDAQVAYAEQLAEQEAAEAERLNNLATFLAEFALENDLTVSQVVSMWEQATGTSPEGLQGLTQAAYDEMKRLQTAFGDTFIATSADIGTKSGNVLADKLDIGLSRAETETRTHVSSIIASLNQISAAAVNAANAFNYAVGGASGSNSYNMFPYASGGGTYTPRTSYYQHGGEMIVSQPTHFVAGEGGAPERVVVQPLSPIGGNIGVSWQGGAIPLHGTGSLTGADMGAMAGVFNQMLRGFAMEYIKQRSTVRGQRGR